MYNYRYFILYLTLLWSNNAFAHSDDDWQFVLTPVLWNASVEATLSDDNSGGENLPIDTEYHFFTLENMDDYLSLKFDANHGRFGILFDSLRARYQDETANRLANFIVGTELGFVELSVRYQLLNEIKLNLIGGVRRSFLDIDQTLVPPVGSAITTKYTFHWTDPLIGLHYHYPFSSKWHVWLRGDIGGFNVSTQRTFNFSTDLQYMINSRFSFTMGYRYLHIDFKEDDLLYDVSLNGIQIGIGIHF
jgi:opacity protein-like surface antigen